MQQSFGFKKIEHLKSRKKIGLLFSNRQSVGAYPLRLFWGESDPNSAVSVQVGFSVSKRTCKLAVKRNYYKRLMREAYRLNKHDLNDFLDKKGKKINVMLLYVGKNPSDFYTIQKNFLKLINKLKKEIV